MSSNISSETQCAAHELSIQRKDAELHQQGLTDEQIKRNGDDAAASRRLLDKLRIESGQPAETSCGEAELKDVCFDRTGEALYGAAAIARWRFNLKVATPAACKRIYYERKLYERLKEDAGYFIYRKNTIALLKSKYRAFMARRQNGGRS